MKSIKTHVKTKVIIIYEKYKCNTRSQKPGESIADFAAGLKSCARPGKFGNVTNDTIKNRFVVGISDAATQRALLREAELYLQKAVSIAN